MFNISALKRQLWLSLQMKSHPILRDLVTFNGRPWREMWIHYQPMLHEVLHHKEKSEMRKNLLPYFMNKSGICIGGALRWEFQEYLKSVERVINVDCVRYFVGEPTIADYVCDATDLHFAKDCEFDFVCSSHVLEHISNPIKALKEWMRVVNRGGIIYCGVPDKRVTFDHARKRTTLNHLINDYKNDVGTYDVTHLFDIVYNTDMSLIGGKSKEEIFNIYLQYALSRGTPTSQLHHHVFVKKDLTALFKYVGLEILFANSVGDTIHLVGRKL
jgi:SAM-dependent methyltransferase